MSEVKAYIGTDPNGQKTEMAQLIVTKKSRFTLRQIPKDDNYTLTLNIRGTSSNVDIRLGYNTLQEIQCGSTWKKYIIKFDAKKDDLLTLMLESGTFYLWECKLERGDIASEWSAAPEDDDSRYDITTNLINQVKQTADSNTASISALTKAVSENYEELSERNSSLEQTVNGFKTEVSSTYTKKVDFDQTMKSYSTTSQMNSAIDQKADSIEAKVSNSYATKDTVSGLATRMSTAESSIRQNASNIELKVDSTDFTGGNLVSMINLTPKDTKISSGKIMLSGDTTIENGFKLTANNIKGGVLELGRVKNSDNTETEASLVVKDYGNTLISADKNGLHLNDIVYTAYKSNIEHYEYSDSQNRSASGFGTHSVGAGDMFVGLARHGTGVGNQISTISGLNNNVFFESVHSNYGGTKSASNLELKYDGTRETKLLLRPDKNNSYGREVLGGSNNITAGSVGITYELSVVKDGSASRVFHVYASQNNSQSTASGSLTMYGGGDYYGNLRAYAFNTWSDRRLKNNIETIRPEESENIVYSLKPKKYKLNSDETHKTKRGFIAQDVLDILGHDNGIVYEDDTDEKMLSLGYTELLADIVNVVQAQKKCIDELNKRIQKLESL